jgi:hypothetical protein
MKSIGNTVLRTVFEAKGDEVKKRTTLHDCYSSHNVIRKIKLRNMKWTALTERIEKKDGHGMLVERSAEKRPF